MKYQSRVHRGSIEYTSYYVFITNHFYRDVSIFLLQNEAIEDICLMNWIICEMGLLWLKECIIGLKDNISKYVSGLKHYSRTIGHLF